MTFIALILSFVCGLLIGRYILKKPVIVIPAVDLTDEEMQKIQSDLDTGGLVKLPQIFKKKKKGAIYLPQTDLEEAREEIIRKNREAGLDTPIKDLTEDE